MHRAVTADSVAVMLELVQGEAGVNLAPIAVGNRDQHEAMTAFIARHRIRPVVDVVYDLTRLQDAYRHLLSGQFFGKVGVNLL